MISESAVASLDHRNAEDHVTCSVRIKLLAALYAVFAIILHPLYVCCCIFTDRAETFGLDSYTVG